MLLDPANTPVKTTVYRKDYRPPAFLVDAIDLTFELAETSTKVTNKFSLKRNPIAEQTDVAVLDGDGLVPESIKLNGDLLDAQRFEFDQRSLTINAVPDEFELEIVTLINPRDNTQLMGLYQSAGNFCTQCEAEGFRKISFFPDRPDVLAVYTVTIYADEQKYPVLLSNGNRVDSGKASDGRHWVRWHDPHPKPSYLFALVAGDLEKIDGEYTTASGRKVLLEVYSEAHNIDQCAFALESLKQSMAWDERVYGLEYDLDIYMVVAVDDFNMGAMENKGLNVFNTKYVLADSKTATDSDFMGVESVIGHEYFHNWSGNRVTCRDWFQLSLKEGFTVFRDQQFSADMHSRGVKRVQDVDVLRTYQFKEDSSSMSHPVRPESYQEINNFYTLTIYNKGAEVVRMIHSLAGEQGFRQGSDLYFQRHDGNAVTIEDFVSAMEDANALDLSQFRLWYSQKGTPSLQVVQDYDADAQQYRLTITQLDSASPEDSGRQPFQIPIKLGLLDAEGRAIKIVSDDAAIQIEDDGFNALLDLTDETQSFVFTQVASQPICSFLRDFSAPVKLDFSQSDDELGCLMSYDSDPFNRWEAAQRLMRKTLVSLIEAAQSGEPMQLPENLIAAFKQILSTEIDDQALIALSLTPPSENYLAQQQKVIDPDAIHLAREFMVKQLALQLKPLWLDLYQRSHSDQPYQFDHLHVGRRSLKQVCLNYLMALDTAEIWQLAVAQFNSADNMTEQLAAFQALAKSSSPELETVVEQFYQQYREHALSMDKWLAVQATVAKPDTLGKIKQLEKKTIFDRKNPNKLRSLVGTFVMHNPVCFHALDGSGYEYLTDWVIELDQINPQVAARLVGSFSSWRKYNQRRQDLMQAALQRLNRIENLSADVAEIVSKALSADS